MTTGDLIDKYGWPPSIWPEEYRPKDNCLLLLQEIRQEIEQERDGWIKWSDPEWHAFNKAVAIIDKHIKEIEGC